MAAAPTPEPTMATSSGVAMRDLRGKRGKCEKCSADLPCGKILDTRKKLMGKKLTGFGVKPCTSANAGSEQPRIIQRR